jgi:transposase
VKLTDIHSQSDIPTDIATLSSLFWRLLQEHQHLSQQYQLLRKETFGRKSEKIEHDPNQQTMLDELLAQLPPEEAPEAAQDYVTVKPHQRRRKHPGRNAIPEDIPREQHIIEPPEEEKTCTCGCAKVKLGEAKRVVVERIPARYIAHEYIRPKYVCPRCRDGVTVAEPPLVSPIAKGMAGMNLLLFVLLSKYRYHLPLYRIQRQIYHESRIWFTRSTMVGWIAEVCTLLKRVYGCMCNEVKSGMYLHGDESLVRLCPAGGGSQSTYMWVYVGAGGRVAVFDYRDSRGKDAPRQFLNGCTAGTYLMIDGYAAYDAAIDKYKLVPMICLAHVRREFIEAAEVGDQREYANRIIRFIGQLYRVERFATARSMNAEQRLQLRRRVSAPIMDKIKQALLQPGFAILPQSYIGKAINYLRKYWDRATRFLERGELPIDNNIDERVIRTLTIGRKNWMFIASEAGGKRMAILYSFLATCALLGVDPEQYLPDVLMRLAVRPAEASVADLTPLEWLKARNGGALPDSAAALYPSKN